MKYLATLIVFIALAGVAHADGFAQALDKVAGNYIANVDYDSFTPEIASQNASSFSFQLWNKDRTETVPYSDVSVNIFKEGNRSAIFLGTLNNGFGAATMKYTFEDAGAYTIQVRFHNDKYETLADVTFPLTVVSGGEGYGMKMLWFLLAGVIGLGLGVGAMYVYKRNS